MGVNPLFLVFPLLSLVLSLAALVIGFTAPHGRRALTSIGGGLLLVGSGLVLVLMFGNASIHEAVSALNGGRTGNIVLGVIRGVADFFWATGLLLVALAATRRRPRPRAVPAGAPTHAAYGAPHGAHQGAPQAGPQRPGPQGGPGHGGPGYGGPRQPGPGHPGPRPPHTPR
ncbi:hypothetical protein [Nocardiopsis protaetiae]|uniref:hypothetical protein n=1 Tax=Nocardiopsis protaetiae TaxID=3382270 RepID=UPI00387B5055